jgi:hypothetical protein
VPIRCQPDAWDAGEAVFEKHLVGEITAAADEASHAVAPPFNARQTLIRDTPSASAISANPTSTLRNDGG